MNINGQKVCFTKDSVSKPKMLYSLATRATLLRKDKISFEKHKMFLNFSLTFCFRNKCSICEKQRNIKKSNRCFYNNIPSFEHGVLYVTKLLHFTMCPPKM